MNRKNSKEIAEFGLMLIKSGLEKGWDKEVLKRKSSESQNKNVNFSPIFPKKILVASIHRNPSDPQKCTLPNNVLGQIVKSPE